jgi:hypothetical protein
MPVATDEHYTSNSLIIKINNLGPIYFNTRCRRRGAREP